MKCRRVPDPRPTWRLVVERAEQDSWFPLIFDRTVALDRQEMDELMVHGEVVFVHDTIDAQLGDFIKTQNPHIPAFTDEDLAARVATKLSTTPSYDYGRWVFYPWSKRLVHVLPPDEFFELRSDRNRQKITRTEQQKLSKLKIGLVGLSVGNAVAVTLALEGLFGELRMADFDTLDLSNMNRIRCAVDQIGLNKAVICARQIYEQNPYANLVLYTDGFTKENVIPFIEEGGRLDIVIDECDSIYAKLKIREEAKARQIPVLMETSDRGMLDIERFDLEPDRPVLHGLLGPLRADEVDAIPPPARVGLVLRVVGRDTMSARAAASMLELGRTIRAFSQLGSDVTLGGATTSIAVRRIALGLPLPSGRVYIDANKMFATEVINPAPPPPKSTGQNEQEDGFVRRVVAAAVLAPSQGNSQPWRFRHVRQEKTLEVHHDPARITAGEPGFAWAWVSIGAAIENIVLAAAAEGRKAEVELQQADAESSLVARARFGQGARPTEEDPAYAQVSRRTTSFRLGTRANLSPVHAQVLIEAARTHGAKLQVCTDRAAIDQLAALIGEAERLRLLSQHLRDEVFGELRWTPQEAEEQRIGLDLRLLELSPMDHAVLHMLRSTEVAGVLRNIGGGQAAAMRMLQMAKSASAFGYLTLPGRTSQAYVRGGQAMQQVWLTASALGLAVQPCNGLLDLFLRVERFRGKGLATHEISATLELRERFSSMFSVSLNDVEVVLLRLSHVESQGQPSARSLRLPVERVLEFD